MQKLEEKQMKSIYAGSISGALLTAISKAANSFLDIGRCIGSGIRRIVDRNLCRY